MLKIWGRRNSSNVQKVLWCCDELGLEYERVDAGGEFGVIHEADTASYRPKRTSASSDCFSLTGPRPGLTQSGPISTRGPDLSGFSKGDTAR